MGMEKAANKRTIRYSGAFREECMDKYISVGHNLDCESNQHTHHLCYMVHNGLHLSDEHYYQILIKGVKFKCKLCGRGAKNENNLCQPLRLK
jgi:hypothetical protein